MNKINFLIGFISLMFLGACAHSRFGISCSDYCFASGGQCSYVREGHREYNTSSGQYQETPTVFVCKYDR